MEYALSTREALQILLKGAVNTSKNPIFIVSLTYPLIYIPSATVLIQKVIYNCPEYRHS